MRRNAKFLLLIVSCLMTVDSLQRNDYNIVNRPKNGNETVDNIKVVFIDSFKPIFTVGGNLIADVSKK